MCLYYLELHFKHILFPPQKQTFSLFIFHFSFFVCKFTSIQSYKSFIFSCFSRFLPFSFTADTHTAFQSLSHFETSERLLQAISSLIITIWCRLIPCADLKRKVNWNFFQLGRKQQCQIPEVIEDPISKMILGFRSHDMCLI